MTGIEDTGDAAFMKVADALRAAIREEELVVGDKLPTSRALVEKHNVSPATVVKAIEALRRDGVVEVQRGRGAFVIAPPVMVRRGSQRYLRSNPQLPGTNLDARPEVGTADRDVARRLQIEVGAPCSVIHYAWRTSDDRPLQFSTQWEPLSLTGGTPIEQPDTTGAHTVIERYDTIGIHVDRVNERHRPRRATAEERARLALPPGEPVLQIVRTHWAGDLAVETATIVIRGDRIETDFDFAVPPPAPT